MREPWRPLVLAAALNVTVGVGAALAQTVIVRKVPAGTSVEVVLNATKVGTATPDGNGDAIVPVDMKTHIQKTETDALVFVDSCDTVRRVVVVERIVTPPQPEPSCTRRDMGGLFLVRSVSSLVVDVGGPNPTLLLRQGSYSLAPPRTWAPSPTGLVFFGGAGLSSFSDQRIIACGTQSQCGDEEGKLALAAGMEFWFTRFLSAEATYIKPQEWNIAGSGETYSFTSRLHSQVVTVSGKVGVPIGPVRLYGKVGTNFNQSTVRTSQTTEDTTVTVDDVPVTIPGGTQSYELKMEGWGLAFGGGMEAWLNRSVAIYGEAGRAWLKGDPVDNVEGVFDDKLTTVLVGVKVRIGR